MIKRQVSLSEIIQFLEAIRERPGMYFGSDEPEKLQVFLFAFSLGGSMYSSDTFVFGQLDTDEFYREIVESRGWKWSPKHFSAQMKERGFKNKEIIDEMISVQIEILKRRYPHSK